MPFSKTRTSVFPDVRYVQLAGSHWDFDLLRCWLWCVEVFYHAAEITAAAVSCSTIAPPMVAHCLMDISLRDKIPFICNGENEFNRIDLFPK